MKVLHTIVLGVLALLVCAGSLHAEKIKFQNGQLITDFEGANPCTTTSYGATGEVGMATIFSGCPDSLVGKRAKAYSGYHHVLGHHSAKAGKSRILRRTDVSAIPSTAMIISADLYLYCSGLYGSCNSDTLTRVYCTPLDAIRTWTSTLTDGGTDFMEYAGADSSPSWSHFKYWDTVGGGDSTWLAAGADSARSLTLFSGTTIADCADTWEAEKACDYAAVWMHFDVTSALRLQWADSTVDVSTSGFLLQTPSEDWVVGSYLRVVDDYCTDPTKRPYLVVEYVDTTHTRTIPLQLGAGLRPSPTYLDTPSRDLSGRIVILADTHCNWTTSYCAQWDSLCQAIIALSPKPVAVFHLGDICVNSNQGTASVDSMRAKIKILTDAGIEYALCAAGNWETTNAESLLANPFAWTQHWIPELYGRRYYAVDLGFALCLVVNSNTGFWDGVYAANRGCVDDSLGSPYSAQWAWLKGQIENARAGQPILVMGHKPFALGAWNDHRVNFRDYYPDQAEALCQMLGTGGKVAAVLCGHQHGYSRSALSVVDAAGDTVYTRPGTTGAIVRRAAGDSSFVYLVLGEPYTGAAVNDSLVARGQVARWENSATGLRPYFTVLDISGAWIRAQPIDLDGAAIDTLDYRRGI